MKHLLLYTFISVIFLPATAHSADLVFMVLDHNSYVANLAVRNLEYPIDIRVITADDVTNRPDEMKGVIDGTRLIVVDVMGRELETFLTENISLQSKTLYALRGSLDDESLKKQGFIFDPDVSGYYRHLSVENIQNMLRLVIQRHIDKTVTVSSVVTRPKTGIYHPDAGGIFTDVSDFHTWQEKRPGYDTDKPRIGFLFFSSFLTLGQQEPVDAIIRRLEEEGFTVFPCYGREQDIIESYFLDNDGNSRVDIILAFSFKFYNALTPELHTLLKTLDVPIVNAVGLYKDTLEKWRESPVGIDALEVSWSLAVPEISGVMEPVVLAAKEKIHDSATGKAFFINRPVIENMDRILPRLENWINLQNKANNDKRLAILFYNHHQGKQNIGASYLNVFESIEAIMTALRENGYRTGPKLSEKDIKALILESARNIGSWAPGELDKLMASGRVIKLPIETYKQWFETLPQAFKKNVVEQWGQPENAKIMTRDGNILIPAVSMDNILLLPEPSRGWGDEPMKLFHDTTLHTHHQYLAVYLWLQKGFKADAMIHLGTHSTYEWTPGKQAGLSPACPPEVLITDIPNLYPYIVDNVGEGIQAKRRGRGVVVSHLTPTLRVSELHEEYSRMSELINEIERAKARGSITVEEKTKELMSLAETTGILEDLKAGTFSHEHDTYHDKNLGTDHEHAGTDLIHTDEGETIHLLGHYLDEIKESLIPYGMHTFGVSPPTDETTEMSAAIHQWNPELKPDTLAKNIADSGSLEMAGLIRGLNGRFVPPGQGNDPIRNPEALPTGKNFYGFNPGKLPSPSAWELGKKAADEIIENHIINHGSYPQKVAVVLWATETLRNEGVNESTILYLIGTKPRWSKTGRILGLDLIEGDELNRPRIDVMVNASGLYRDMFPEKMLTIDRAIRMAARQTDVENLIARHNREIKTRLIRNGMTPDEAEEMSKFRVFSENVGSYGTGIGDLASGSSKWDDPDQVVAVYEKRTGFAFSEGTWGLKAQKALKANLSNVDVTLHSRSSNIYGMLDNDDMFQYLGGLSMAVKKESGETPETLITRQQKKGRVHVEDAGKAIGREMRTRYLNPKWIEGMKSEDYAGAKAMSDFVEYLWGWNMTTPEKIDAAKWRQTYEVYVEDKYDLDLKNFFDKASPWAFQSITGRMLETHRKGYWKADPDILETLAAEYVKSVVQKGIACCDHTCNNPLLNQMIVSIISIPGVISPELVQQFKLAVEQMAKADLDQQVADRKELIKKLKAPAPDKPPEPRSNPDSPQDIKDSRVVEGYKMEPIDKKEDTTQLTSSGIEWTAVATVLGITALAVYGARRKHL